MTLFITQEELLRAEAQTRVYPRNRILPKLIESADQAVAASPKLLSISPFSNLFVLQNAFLDLSLASLLTSNETYQQCATDLARRLDDDAWRRRSLPEEIHVAFVLIGLAVFLDLLGDRLESVECDRLRRMIREMAQQLVDASRREEWGRNIPKRNAWNHSVVPFSAIGAAGLTLSDSTTDEWVDLAEDRLVMFCREGIAESGMTREGLAYCGFVLRNAGLFMRGLHNSRAASSLLGQSTPAFERMASIPNWYAAEMFPGGRYLQNSNDSYWDPHPALRGFLLVFGERHPDLSSYVWEHLVGAAGLQTFGQDLSLRNSSLFESMLWHPGLPDQGLSEPERTDFYCPDVGYYCERSDWFDDASLFSFNSGEFIGGIHDQADNNSFTFLARGVPLIIDAGAANSAVEGSPSSSLGHSSVLIDGKGQRPSGAGHGVSGSIVRLDTGRESTIVVGDSTRSYNGSGYNSVFWAFRHCVFGKVPFPHVLVFDDIRKDDAVHQFEFVFHTPTFVRSPQVTGGTISGEIAFEGRSCPLTIEVLSPQEMTISTENFISPRQDPFEEHQLWRIATEAINPYFLVLILPGAVEDIGTYTADVRHHEDEILVDLAFANFDVDRRIRLQKQLVAKRGTTT